MGKTSGRHTATLLDIYTWRNYQVLCDEGPDTVMVDAQGVNAHDEWIRRSIERIIVKCLLRSSNTPIPSLIPFLH
jgi:hypothetical protein